VADAGSAEAADDVVAAPFCLGIQPDTGTICEDFDGQDAGHHPAFKLGTGFGAAEGTVDKSAFVSPPAAFRVGVAHASVTEQAQKGVEATLAPFRGGKIRCEVSWRVATRPSAEDDSMEVIVLQWSTPTKPFVAHAIAEAVSGQVSFYGRPIGSAKSADWSHVSITLDFGAPAIDITLNGIPVPGINISTDATDTLSDVPGEIRVYVGAWVVSNGPWDVSYDNVACVSE